MENSRDKMNILLKKIWDDKDFILGVNSHIKNDFAVQEMIKYLEKNKDDELDPSSITETALYIRFGDSIKHKLSLHITDN